MAAGSRDAPAGPLPRRPDAPTPRRQELRVNLVRPLTSTIRPAAQAAAAAAATYAIMLALGWHGQASWAVISALYVVQPHLDGTLSNAAARLGGTALGTAIGLGILHAVGFWPPGVAASLAAAVLLLTTLSGYHPGLRFGLIPAAVLILAPQGDPVVTAWARAGAIGLGAVVGTVASLTVFPKAASRSVEQGLGQALRRCADLLAASSDALLGRGDRRFDPINGDIRRSLQATAAQAGQALRQRERVDRRRRRPPPGKLHHAVRSLWHSILMLERTSEQPLDGALRQAVEAPLAEYREAVGQALRRVAESLAGSGAPPRTGAVSDSAEALRAAVATVPPADGGGPAAVLAFAVAQIARDTEAITALIEARE